MCEMCDKFSGKLDKVIDALKPVGTSEFQSIRSSIARNRQQVVSDCLTYTNTAASANDVFTFPVTLTRPMSNFKGIDRPYNPYLYIHSFVLTSTGVAKTIPGNWGAFIIFEAINGNKMALGSYVNATDGFNYVDATLNMPYAGNDVQNIGTITITVTRWDGANTPITFAFYLNLDIGYNTASNV